MQAFLTRGILIAFIGAMGFLGGGMSAVDSFGVTPKSTTESARYRHYEAPKMCTYTWEVDCYHHDDL